MKAEIRADGMLVIESETGVEAYALGKWCQDNLLAVRDCRKIEFRYPDPREMSPEDNDQLGTILG